jgi:repressor LexA
MKTLTNKQGAILEYLKNTIQDDGRPPSLREIMLHFKYKGIKAVEDHLNAIENKGYIKRIKGLSRGIEIAGLKKLDAIELPILGNIAAGTPILAEENIEGTIAIDKSWVKDRNSFILHVKGNSMIEAGIHDGDYAIIKQNYSPENSDIVVALIENEATLKRFYKKENKIILKPENSSMEPIIIESGKSNIMIIGKLTGIYRQLN